MADNDKNGRKPKINYEGVIYDRHENNNKNYNPFEDELAPRPVARKTVKKKPSSTKTQYGLFMGLTALAGITVCVIVFLLVYRSIMPDKPNSPTTTTESEETFAAADGTVIEATCVVKATEDGAVTLVEATTDRAITIFLNDRSQIRNKYGQDVSIAEFKIGDIVDVSYNNLNEALVLKKSSQSFEIPNISGLQIDKTAFSIVVLGKTYSYTSNIMAIYKGGAIDLDAITDKDYVTVKGINNQILVVSLEKSNGTLALINSDKIIDGSIEISNILYQAFGETKTVQIPEGIHTVVIKGTNIEPFVKEVKITAGETAELDLESVQIKTGMLSIVVSEPDYELSIDGERVRDLTEPIILPFGTHQITVSKEGFSTVEQEVAVANPTQSISVTLLKQVLMGTLSIASEPPEADVYIDNAYIGTAPISQSLAYGSHRVLVKKAGYVDMPIAVEIKEPSQSYLVTLPQAQTTTQEQTTAQEPVVSTPDYIETTTAYGAPVIP